MGSYLKRRDGRQTSQHWFVRKTAKRRARLRLIALGMAMTVTVVGCGLTDLLG